MILADKIIMLRKKNGWSQEELAEKMNVSRQAVSKWEAAQTIPDLQRILQLGELFGVTTDFLLKDELEVEEYTQDSMENILTRVTMKQANEYLELRKKAAGQIAGATLLCIFSPIALILLTSLGGLGEIKITIGQASGIGLVALFLMVAVAVSIYIYCGFKHESYSFLEEGNFEVEYGVSGLVKDRQKAFRNLYVKMNILATCLCVLSPIPLVVSGIIGSEVIVLACLGIMLVVVGIAVAMFIYVGVQYASMQKLLKEGEYKSKDQKDKKKEAIDTIYWLLVVAIYLGWSFLSKDWHITWIVWPIAGVLSGVITAIFNLKK